MSSEFHDISRLPSDRGMLFFPISISRMSNSQSADACFEHILNFEQKIVKTEGVGVTLLYGDYLYFLTENETPKVLRDRYLGLMTQHKNGILKRFDKDPNWVIEFFSFITYGQTVIDFSDTLPKYHQKLFDAYEHDEFLQKCVAFDSPREKTKEQALFILEESLLLHLLKKQVVSFKNDIINHREEWVLEAYPGKPLATETYLAQKNIFNIPPSGNKYENNFYDADEKKLYDFMKIDIEDFFGIT